MFPSVKWAEGDDFAGVFSRTTAWSTGLIPEYGAKREQFSVVIRVTVVAIPKPDDDLVMRPAVARTWRPISCEEWWAVRPAEHWESEGIR